MIPYQLICEGKADEVFFRRILASMGKIVEVGCPNQHLDGGQGKDAIHKRLIGLQSKFDELTRVVVAVDSDDDPNGAFERARGEFAKANEENPKKSYPVPDLIAVIADLEGAPSTGIILVPSNGPGGSLDSLLIPSFEQAFGADAVGCSRGFCECLGAEARGITKRDKAYLRSLIVAKWAKNPGLSLSFLLEERNCPVEIDHPSFRPVRTLLTQMFP